MALASRSGVARLGYVHDRTDAENLAQSGGVRVAVVSHRLGETMNEGMNAETENRQDWETPDWLFKALDAEFGFTVDVCADKTNKKMKRYFSQHDNGLSRSWLNEIVFCNPPYSETLLWSTKGLHFWRTGKTTAVFVLADRGGDHDWHWITKLPGVECRHFRKRVKFLIDGVPQKGPRFPTVIVIMRRGWSL